MDRNDADKQIKQMIAFIRQEAKEKAEEIRTKTDEEMTVEKVTFRHEETLRIKEEFEKRRKDKLTERRIRKSTKITENRFKVMGARNELVEKLRLEILEKLESVSKNSQYPTFMRYLIVEGLTNIMEEDVVIQCREVDVDIVDAELKAAQQEYEKLVKREVGIQPKIQLSRMEKQFLPPPPSSGRKGASCRGGVVLHACRGKLRLNNTLESRLEQAFQLQKPVVRTTLFGVRERPLNAHPGH